MISSDKSLQESKKDAKRSKLSKSEQKEQQEKQIREFIIDKMDIKASIFIHLSLSLSWSECHVIWNDSLFAFDDGLNYS